MATIKWKRGIDGNFDNVGDWTPGHVPQASDAAQIEASGAYTVRSATNNTVKTLEMAASATLAITAHTFTISGGSGPGGLMGTISVSNAATLTLSGTIDNSGSIKLNSNGGTTELRIVGPLLTLDGGGTISLSNNAANFIVGTSTGNVLDNVDNTISGAGQVGDGQLTLINAGQIVANQVAAMVLDIGSSLQNSGLLESINPSASAGGLVIEDTTINNTNGGKIEALGRNAHVVLNNVTVVGGTLTTSGGGVILDVANSTLDGAGAGVAIKNNGSVLVSDGAALTLDGVIDNIGAINLAAVADNTDLRIGNQKVTLEGGGTVILSNNADNRIFGVSGADLFVNVNNTISGAGQLGIGQITLINRSKGVIDANLTTALTLDSGGNIAVNVGLLEATSTGGLVIESTVNNAGGIISAAGKGVIVSLAGGHIEGGTLETSSGGTLETTAANGNLDGVTAGILQNFGKVAIADSTTLTIEGVIDNTGNIMLASVGDNTDLNINSANVTFEGGGAIMLSNSPANRIVANALNNQLTNVDNTISGAGQIGVGQLRLVNETKGVIDANQVNALVMNSGANLIVNAGLLEDTGSGGLVVMGTVDNAGGMIIANGSGTTVSLAGGSIEGGTLKTAHGGIIETVNEDGTLDGVTAGKITLAGTFNVTDSTVLTIEGTINNTGTINLASTGDYTDIRLNGDRVTLVGGGKIALSDVGTNRIYGVSSTFTLSNVSDTIEGSGQFGTGQMQFRNGGIIDATGASGLTISLGGGSGVNTLDGTIEGAGSGGLTLSSGLIRNSGRIAALDGSFVTFTGANSNNNTQGILSGGTWQAISRGHGATLSLTGGAVVKDAAAIVLSGVGSVFQAGDGSTFTELEQSLTTVDTTGTLQLLSNRGYTTALDISDAGLVQLNGGTFSSHSLTAALGGRFFGFGKVANSILDKGKVEAKGGVLEIAGAVNGNGSLQIDASSTLKLDGSVSPASTVTFAGTRSKLVLEGGAAFAGVVSGFAAAASEAIDLATIKFGGGTKLSYSSGSGILKVTDGAHSVSLHLFQQYVASGFHIAGDGGIGTIITYSSPPDSNVLPMPHH